MNKISSFVIIFVSSSLFAQATITSEVKNLRVDKNGKGYIEFVDTLGGTSTACVSGYTKHLSFDLNDPAGRGIYSLALTAKVTGKKIHAVGSGLCENYTMIETWSWGYLQD